MSNRLFLIVFLQHVALVTFGSASALRDACFDIMSKARLLSLAGFQVMFRCHEILVYRTSNSYSSNVSYSNDAFAFGARSDSEEICTNLRLH